MNFFTVFGIISFSALVGTLVSLLCLWLINKLINKSKHTDKLEVIERSNIIQYDEMGYPLRLVIVRNYKNETDQMWLDTDEQEGDVELKWENHNGDFE